MGRALGLLRLAPWRRAPWLLWRFRSVSWALIAVGAVLSLTSALPTTYLGSTASTSFAGQAAARCPWLVGEQVQAALPLPPAVTAADLAAGTLGRLGRAVLATDGPRAHLGPAVSTLVTGGAFAGRPGADDQTTSVFYRDGGEQHVRVTSRVAGQGLLLTDRVAARLQVRAGGTVRFRTDAGLSRPWRLVGTYVDLADLPVQPFWCSLDARIHLQDAFANFVPPPVALATSAQVALDVARTVNPGAAVTTLVERALAPGLRVDQAEQTLAAVRAVRRADPTGPVNPRVGPRFASDLPFLVQRAHAVQRALTPPIAALAGGAGLATAGLVAIVGSFWAERRRTELELLAARGVGPAALAGKGALECAVPLLAGMVVGAGASVAVLLALDRTGAVTPHSVRLACLLTPAAACVALGVLGTAVRWRLRPVRRRARRRPGFAPLVLLDLLLAVAAVVALSRVSPIRASTDTSLLPSFGLARLALPLLVLVAVARVATRLGSALLRWLRGHGDGWPVPVLLAVQRLAAVPRVPAALAVAVAVSSGASLYAAGLASSLQRTIEAKAQVFVGGDARIELVGRQPLPRVPGTGRVTAVLLLSQPHLPGADATPVDVLAIDPATFRRGAAWDPAFAGPSLETLLRRLSAPADGAVPALAVGPLPDAPVAVLQQNATPLPLALRVVGRPSAFPGLHGHPLLVVSLPVLEAAYPAAAVFATEQLWVSGPLHPLVDRLHAAGLQIRGSLDVPAVSGEPSLEAVLDTLHVLRALGLLGAVLAAMGLVVYVDVRARQRRLASVLTRRMGLTARTDWLTGWLELGAATGTGLLIGLASGLGLVAYVASSLDPLPDLPPGPLVVLPLQNALLLVAGTLLAAGAAALAGLRRSVPDAAVLRAE